MSIVTAKDQLTTGYSLRLNAIDLIGDRYDVGFCPHPPPPTPESHRGIIRVHTVGYTGLLGQGIIRLGLIEQIMTIS